MDLRSVVADLIEAAEDLLDYDDTGQPSGMDMGGHLRYPNPEGDLRRAIDRCRQYLATGEPLADEDQCGFPVGQRPADGLNTDNRFTVLLCVLPSGHLGAHLPAERWR